MNNFSILLAALAVLWTGMPQQACAGEAQNAFNEGVTYQRAGKLKEAIAAYDKAIKADPKAAEAYNNRGLAYYKLGRNEDAIKD